MAIYIKNLNQNQMRMLERFEAVSGVEPLFQRDYMQGEISFSELWAMNLDWLEDLVSEVISIPDNGALDEEKEKDIDPIVRMKRWIGKTALRLGNDNQKPMAVFIAGINGLDLLSCRVLNTGSIVLSDGKDLRKFTFLEFQYQKTKWEYRNACRQARSKRLEIKEIKKGKI